MRWIAPISRAIRRSSTPSSVVRGVLLNSARRTWNGSVGNTLADGDCSMWPEKKREELLLQIIIFITDGYKLTANVRSLRATRWFHSSNLTNKIHILFIVTLTYCPLHRLWPRARGVVDTEHVFSPSAGPPHSREVARRDRTPLANGRGSVTWSAPTTMTRTKTGTVVCWWAVARRRLIPEPRTPAHPTALWSPTQTDHCPWPSLARPRAPLGHWPGNNKEGKESELFVDILTQTNVTSAF